MKGLVRKVMLVCAGMLMTYAAQADIILESATLGPTGSQSGVVVNPSQFVGARFQVLENTTVDCFGGHMYGSDTYFFGALVALSSGGDLPDGNVTGPDFFYVNLFDPFSPSTDLLVDADLQLPPGNYGLVFGSGEFGADSGGTMPLNNTDTPAASYFFWDGGNWNQGGFSNARFVVASGDDCDGAISSIVVRDEPPISVESVPVPAMSTWGVLLLVLAVVAIMVSRRRQAA